MLWQCMCEEFCSDLSRQVLSSDAAPDSWEGKIRCSSIKVTKLYDWPDRIDLRELSTRSISPRYFHKKHYRYLGMFPRNKFPTWAETKLYPHLSSAVVNCQFHTFQIKWYPLTKFFGHHLTDGILPANGCPQRRIRTTRSSIHVASFFALIFLHSLHIPILF